MKTLFLFLVMAAMVSWAGQNQNQKTTTPKIDCEKLQCTQQFKETLKIALSGDAEAQNKLGEMLHFGKGVKKNYHLAKEWYLLASNQGHAMAPNHIGRIYLNGEGVEKNPLEACSWYKLSAERGDEWGKVNYKKCRNRTQL